MTVKSAATFSGAIFSPRPNFTPSRGNGGLRDAGMRCYLKDIRELSRIDADDETRIGRLAANGDEEARRTMIEANLRLVVRLASRFAHTGVPLLDLVEEGNIGLIRAVERFDPERGCRFSTYAGWWIRQSMQRAVVRQGRTVRLPIRVHETLRRVEKASEELTKILERIPSSDEIAAYTGFDSPTVEKIRDVGRSGISLDLRDEDDDHSYGDRISPEGEFDPGVKLWQKKLHSLLAAHLEELNPRQQEILIRRFGLDGEEPMTLKELAGKCRISRERVRQIEMAALKKLRAVLERDGMGTSDI